MFIFIFKAFRVILGYSSNNYMTYITFKVYKKVMKIFIYIYIYIYKRQTNIIKNTKRDSKKKHVKDIKIFLHKKIKKWRNKNLSEEEKGKS